MLVLDGDSGWADLTFKILSGLYLRNHKVKKVDTCRTLVGGVGVLWCDFNVIFDFGFAHMFSADVFEAYVCHKDILIPATDYQMYLSYLIVLFPLTARLHL